MTQYKEFNSELELEFEFLKEFDLPVLKEILDNEKIINLFDYPLKNNIYLCEVVKLVDGKVICFKGKNIYGDSFFTFENSFDLKENEIILLLEDEDIRDNTIKKIWKLDKNILDKIFLNKCWKIKKKCDGITDKDVIDKKELTQKDIENAVNQSYKRDKKEREKEKRKEKKQEKEKEKKAENLTEKFEKESVGKIEDYDVNKNIIIMNGLNDEKWILKKNVNKIFTFEYLNKRDLYGSSTINRIEDFLIGKEESYKKEIEDTKKVWNKEYKVDFNRDKKKEIVASLENKKYYTEIKINGVKISKAKIFFVLNRINKNTKKEYIKLLNKITGMKVDILNLKQIEGSGYKNIDIEISLIDKDTFKVKFLNKTKKVNWDFLKTHFFYGSSRSIRRLFSVKEIIEFIEKLGIKKQDLYNHLRKIKITEELE